MERQMLALHKWVLNTKVAWPCWPGVTAQRYCSASSEGMLCSGPMPYCACVHTSRDWGRLRISVSCSIAHKSHSLGCHFSQLAEFQREICTLNKNLPLWTLGLASAAYSSCMFSCSRVTDPVISTVEKVIWDGVLFLPNRVSHGEQAACYPENPWPAKAEKEQSSPSLQNIQRNIYSTYASNAARVLKKTEVKRGHKI